MSLIISFFLGLLAPIYGGIFYGIDRVLKAKMQRRMGPPLMQPFYDMAKLFSKTKFIVNAPHTIWMIFYFLTLWIVIFMIFFGGNILYIIFGHLLATIFFVASGYSVNSIFSQLGSNRKLLSIVAYEPVLILNTVCIYLVFGTFEISEILVATNSFDKLFLTYLSLLFVVPVVLKLSPFDASKAHQEIVGGIEVEFGGIFYEIVYASKFLEMIFIYSFIFILTASDYLFGFGLVVLSFFVVALVDNSTARIKIDSLIKIIYIYGFGLATISMIWNLL